MLFPSVDDIKSFWAGIPGLGTLTVSDAQISLFRSSFIDALKVSTGTEFEKTEALDRRYSGRGVRHLHVDPYVTLNSVKVAIGNSQSAETTVDFDLRVIREYQEVGGPKCRLEIDRTIYTSVGLYPANPYHFIAGNLNIIVNAEWGWAETIPNDVVMGFYYNIIQQLNLFNSDQATLLSPLVPLEWEEKPIREKFRTPIKGVNNSLIPTEYTFRALTKKYRSPMRRIRRERPQFL